MTKYIACNDIVPGCKFTAEAATESELVEKVKAHAEKVHAMGEVTPELLAKVKAAIETR
jgi:predicted small metal-binding protein